MTQRQLTALGRRWQKRLRLDSWKIRFRVCKTLMDGGVECDGLARIERDHLEATIRVRSDIEDGAPAPFLQRTVEQTVVHELLHCLIPRVTPIEQEETVINVLAEALLRRNSAG